MATRLAEQVRENVGGLCDGHLPEGLVLEVDEGYVTLSGSVENPQMAEAIERAVASTPGVLKIHNEMETRETPPPEPVRPADLDAGVVCPAPTERTFGQVNHKV